MGVHSPIDRFIANIRRHETPGYERLYRIARSLRSLGSPVIPGVHHSLYQERRVRVGVWRTCVRVLYNEPLFKSQCECVGKNVRIIGGIPLLMGQPLHIRIGDDVTISGVTTFIGSKMADRPILEIGSGSHIGYQTAIVSGLGVYIGRDVLIANRVFIAADDGHPLHPASRRLNMPVPAKALRTIHIDDGAWLGEGSTVLKGVRVGRGAIVGAHAVVTKDVPPDTVVAGNPAREVKRLDLEAEHP